MNLDDLRTAHRAGQRQPGEGELRRHRGRRTRSAPTISCCRSDEYAPLIIAYRNGAPVQLSDVADVIDGAENVRQAAWMNETPAVIVNIQRQPGANIIEVVDRIKKLLPQLQASLPSAVASRRC